MSLFICHPTSIYQDIKEDSIEYHSDIPLGGYQNEKEDNTIKPDVESAKPCHLCEHDNAKDNTCIYCNNEHRCWSRKR